METLMDNETLSFWLIHYGSFALFLLLALGIIALPIPEETLMVLAGILMHKGLLQIPPTVMATYAGSICGISISYVLGRTLGNYFIHKYGSWIGLTEQRLQQANSWFERFGKWSLLIGYFIPGVRHFTGFSAGVTNLEYKQFAIFAYIGAILWGTLFLSIGYFFGNCLAICKDLEITDILMIILILLGLGYLVYRLKKKYARTH